MAAVACAPPLATARGAHSRGADRDPDVAGSPRIPTALARPVRRMAAVVPVPLVAFPHAVFQPIRSNDRAPAVWACNRIGGALARLRSGDRIHSASAEHGSDARVCEPSHGALATVVRRAACQTARATRTGAMSAAPAQKPSW